MDTAKLAQIAKTHQGTITAHSDSNLVRVEFTLYPRLAGFQDDMVSRRLPATVEGNAVIVQL